MLSSVFAKALRDRWVGMAIAAGLVALWLPLAMGIYRDIDISIYTDLPEGIRTLMGIPEGADSATLAYNVMLDFAAALTMAGMAVSIGASTIAGEERSGTFALLLASPRTRTQILVSKLLSLLVLVSAGTTLLWGAAELSPALLDIEIGETHLAAMMLHLGINAIFYGTLALAVGASTGNRSLASALPAAVMIVSYFAVGLLPLADPVAGLTKAFPWYYFSGSDPLVNGVSWTHLTVLVAGSVVCSVIAVIGLNRRDVRGPTVGDSMLDRLRENPVTARVFERLAGSTRVSRLWIKATSEHQALLFVTALVMFAMMGVLMGPMYSAIEDDLAQFGDNLPDAVLALAGGGDLSTPEGWFTTETFSLMAPVAVMVVTLRIGATALAGEEANGTLGLLLANPISRSRIVLENSFAMVVYAAVVGAATFAGVAVANLISGLGMSYGAIAATSLLVTLLGLLFGAVALAVGAASGQSRLALFVTIGAALTSHLLNSFLPLSDNLAGWARLTPHHYFLGSDPLNEGMHWGHAALLASVTAAFVAVAAMAINHRDLRVGVR